VSGIVQTSGRLSIRGLRDAIAKVDGPRFRSDLSMVCAEAAGQMINDEFRRSVDPYGDPWEPLKSREGKPLLKTGRLRASFATQVVEGGFRIDATAVYAPYHQFGTGGHTRRPRFQPIDKRGRFASRRKAGAKKRGRVDVRFLPGGHQGGITARPMVPTPEQGGLPYLWQRRFAKEAKDLVVRTLGATP
jgi:phage gpG-like protein